MNCNLLNGVSSLSDDYEDEWDKFGIGWMRETEEEDEDDYAIELFGRTDSNRVFKPMESIKEEALENSSTFSFDFMGGMNIVSVAVMRQSLEESMDALRWALINNNNNNNNHVVVLLIHVYPKTKFIPTLLGNLPVSQVNPEQKKIYMAQERHKRRELLQKYLDLCSKFQVKADIIQVENDTEAKAILDLIPILNIRKLVLGVTKSTARRLRSKKGNGVTEQIVQNAAEFCDVKIICEGKELTELTSMDFSSSPSSDSRDSTKSDQGSKHSISDNMSCGCFGMA